MLKKMNAFNYKLGERIVKSIELTIPIIIVSVGSYINQNYTN